MESLETRLNNLNKTIVSKNKSRPKYKQSRQITKKISPEFKLVENEFPLIAIREQETIEQESIEQESIDYTKIKDSTNLEDNYSDIRDKSRLKLKPGWILLSHNQNLNFYRKDTKDTKDTDTDTDTDTVTDTDTDTVTETMKEPLSSRQILNLYEQLFDRWNNYRDEQNDLYGQSSLYWNYREDLQKMIDEDNKFYNDLEDRIKYNKDQYNSDDEDNRYVDINEHIQIN